MTEEKKQKDNNKEAQVKESKAKDANKGAVQAVAKSVYGEKKRAKRPDRKPMRKEDDFEQRILDLARVTRVMAGGKRMRFRACVAVGGA